ncbi:MAG: YqaE/Pmp3 family membrane protein [Bacteroidota bacterium]
MKKTNFLTHGLWCAVIVIVINACSPDYGRHFTSSTPFYEGQKNVTQTRTITNQHLLMADTLREQRSQGVAPPQAEELMAATENELVMAKQQEVRQLIKKHQTRLAEITSNTAPSKERSKLLKKEKRKMKRELKQKVKKDIKALKEAQDDDEYVLMMILALLIPPLGIGLTYGITTEFWLSLLLTILFFIPGAVYSLIKVHQYFKG